jgi:N-methylhydantoinase A/oxoprolinase/acetone carboxylase beta subunit
VQRIAVDICGTFTDLVYINDNKFKTTEMLRSEYGQRLHGENPESRPIER